MQLYDKDLLSVQEVRDLVEKAKKAQQEESGRGRCNRKERCRSRSQKCKKTCEDGS